VLRRQGGTAVRTERVSEHVTTVAEDICRLPMCLVAMRLSITLFIIRYDCLRFFDSLLLNMSCGICAPADVGDEMTQVSNVQLPPHERSADASVGAPVPADSQSLRSLKEPKEITSTPMEPKTKLDVSKEVNAGRPFPLFPRREVARTCTGSLHEASLVVVLWCREPNRESKKAR